VTDAGFINAPGGDYRLTAASLLRDSGDDAQVEPGELDLDGQPRISGAVVDVGAYEFTTAIIQVPPAFTLQPANATVTAGGTVTFTAAASGTPTPGLQWQRMISGSATWDNIIDGGLFSGAATGTLTITGATATMNGDQFRCVADNGVGPPAISNAAGLTAGRAVATVTISNTTQTFDGAPKAVSVATSPAGLTVLVTYNGIPAAPSAAGDYAVTATVVDPNYQGSATATLTIAKATIPIALSNLSQTYDGTPKAVIAIAPGFAVLVTYDGSVLAPSAAGDYAVIATVVDPNYQGSATGTLTIAKATAFVTLTNIVQTFDGTPKAVTIVTSPPLLAVSVTYNGSAVVPSALGAYEVVATVSDPNYQGTGTGVLSIIPVTGNTPPGSDVMVAPAILDEHGDPAINPPVVDLDFTQVIAAGNTTITMLKSGPPPPTGFRLTDPTLYLDISTTATFSGTVGIAIDYSALPLAGDPADLRLGHFVSGAWVDITALNDTAAKIIYGVTDSFSIFAVFRPAEPLEALGELEKAVAALHSGKPTIRGLQALLRPVRLLLEDKQPKDDPLALVPLVVFVGTVEAGRGRQIPVNEANVLIARADELIRILLKRTQNW
jgi:hypothetical protein